MTYNAAALKIIQADPWLSTGEIAEQLGITSGHASLMLENMSRDRPRTPATVRWEANETRRGRPLRRWATVDCSVPLPVTIKED